MPEQLVHALREQQVVIFAGAGISTEAPTVLPVTLYDHVRAELEMPEQERPPFPEVMSRFVAVRGRPALLETVKERLDYVRSFPNIDGQASAFHRALAPLFPISEIVTTNWDEYFERFTGAQPFVTDEDWAFSRTSLRKVFKLHGSIASPGSLVATSEDYARCYRELGRGLLGARLKELLATKTVVFAGYSLRDSDFARVYKLIANRMGELLPRSYLVTIDDGEPPSLASGMHVIGTSGTHFLNELARQIPPDEFVPESRLRAIPMIRAILRELHHELVDASEMSSDPALLSVPPIRTA